MRKFCHLTGSFRHYLSWQYDCWLLFSDEGLQQSSPDFSVNGNHSSNDSSPPESPFKPWKTTSPALLLRHFAASSSKQPSGGGICNVFIDKIIVIIIGLL